jgi:outer membrane protein TolC
LALLPLTLPAAARASPPGLDAYVAEVVARNPSIKARQLRSQAFVRESSAQGLWPDPLAQVMVDNVPRRTEGDMPMIRYQLTQMLPWPGKLELMERASLRRGDVARAETKRRRVELTLEAKRAWWMLAANARRREVNRSSRGLLKTVVSAAIARYSVGGSHHEVARSQVELDAAEVEAIDLDGERRSIVAMMNALRDRPTDTKIADPRLARDPAIPKLPSTAFLVRSAIARRPELEGMRAMQREEQAMAALARRERYPDLMAGLWYNQMLGEPDTMGFMVGATLPLFGARRQARLADASELRAWSASNERRAMEAMIRYEITDAVRRVETAARSLSFIRTVAHPRAQESFVSSLSSYSTGTADLQAVLDAWRALQTLELSRADASLALEIARAELERAVGGPLRTVSR